MLRRNVFEGPAELLTEENSAERTMTTEIIFQNIILDHHRSTSLGFK